MIGQTVSHYTITAKLGAGGMGEVYLADDTRLDRQVALKFLPEGLWNVGEAQQRLIREAKAASKLDHPNIVTIFGIDEFEGRPFIIMSRVHGVTLSDYCSSKDRSIDELVALAVQIADGVHHAHGAGVVHRDLKPSNILVDTSGRARVLDFGIASLRGAAKLTQTGSTVGTLAYAAPELAKGQEAAATADVYSLGVVLYQMLTGRLPYDADHEAALLYSILNEPPLPMTQTGAKVPPKLEAVVMRCLEKNPEDRYQSCAELTSELKGAIARPDTGAPKTTPTQRPSIAVLPFANMSADPENEYFSDGLSEELLNVLAKNAGLRVTGRTSSFAFKGKNEDLREIGQKLGVETLLEGSVRKAGDRVRITAQLVKVSDGFHLWSETYDRVLDDIFAVQDDIAQSVAGAMHVTLLGAPSPTVKHDPESYNLILQANYLTQRVTEEALEQAVSLYQKALDIDPDDTRALAGLARAYATQAGYGFTENAAGYTAAREAAQRALQLDESVAQAHEMLGWVAQAFDFDWDASRKHSYRAYELAPGDSRVLTALAAHEGFCGDLRKGREFATEAVTLDPLNPFAHLFRARLAFIANDYDAAEMSFREALVLSPGITTAHMGLAFSLLLPGKAESALAEAAKERSNGYRFFALTAVHHALGNKAESDKSLANLLREGEQWGFQIAGAYASRGEVDKAFAWLERAYELRDPGIPSTKYLPFFKSLHGDPRWTEFLRKLKLG